MNPQEQRIAIAEYYGWKRDEIDRRFDWELAERQMQMAEISTDEFYKRHLRVDPTPTPKPIPDYLNDLNAMHEAEKNLKDKDIKMYVSNIWTAMHLSPQAAIGIIHATPAQRAEALLRCIGRWVDL